VGASTIGVDKALNRVAETTQLDERNAGVTIGQGIEPPYPPSQLAAIQELNGTHAVAVAKKASREVGFGFDLVPHDRADDPSDEQLETAEDFWYGRETIWKIGPKGTTVATPTEVFEQARQDYHGIGWLAIELIYTADDQLAGLAHLPAKSVRVRKAADTDERVAGHGYVQKRDGETRFFAEAGDRYRTDVNGNADPVYVDKETGDVSSERNRIDNPANEVLFVPNPHPNALYYGIPTWVSEIETMVGDHEARRFNREFFEWDALGQYFVIVEGGQLTDDSRQDIQNLITGLRDQEGRRVAVLEAEELDNQEIDLEGDDTGDARIRVEQLQAHGEEDQAFTEYRKRNEHDIAKVHEVPPQLVGVMADSNRSNIKEAIRDFTKEKIEPAQERFAGRLFRIIHQQVLDVEDWTIEFQTKGAENEREEAEVANIIVNALEAGMSVREARELFGLEPQPEWMSDAIANATLAELAPDVGPGAALEGALEENREEAAAAARTAERLSRGGAETTEAEAEG
jgi:PBSX family phage portal protein